MDKKHHVDDHEENKHSYGNLAAFLKMKTTIGNCF